MSMKIEIDLTKEEWTLLQEMTLVCAKNYSPNDYLNPSDDDNIYEMIDDVHLKISDKIRPILK